MRQVKSLQRIINKGVALVYLLLCSLLLSACQTTNINAPISIQLYIPTQVSNQVAGDILQDLPTQTPTSIPSAIVTEPPVTEKEPEDAAQAPDFNIPLSLQFDDARDFNYFDVLGIVDEQGEHLVDPDDVILEDSFAIFGRDPLRGANLKPRVNPGTALHVRWKINAENTCHALMLFPMLSQEITLADVYGVGVGACSYQALQVEFGVDDGRQIDAPSKNQGTIVMDDGKWIDAVFWTEASTPPVINLFAWETENPDLYYAEKRLLPGLDDANSYLFSFETYNGEIAVDAFRMVSGNVENYLLQNAPAFQKNHDSVLALLNTDLSRLSAASNTTMTGNTVQQAEGLSVDPANFLLTPDDLQPVCEWQSDTVISRQVAEGLLTFTSINCGVDADELRIDETVLVGSGVFTPEDAGRLIPQYQQGSGYEAQAPGSWSMVTDQKAVFFIKQNVLVYIRPDSVFYQKGQMDREDIIQLAQRIADRIPDGTVSMLLQQPPNGQSVDAEFVSHITVGVPEMRFGPSGSEEAVLQKTQGSALGEISFMAQFTEPQQVTVQIYHEESYQILARWVLPSSAQPVYALEKILQENPELTVNYADDLFFPSGHYGIEASVDGKTIYQREFVIQE